MAGVGVCLGVLVASAVLAPAAAWACEEHDPDERERVAGLAGDSVSIDIPNTLEGAEWLVRIEDAHDELAKGRDEDAETGTEAEFEVPDLGEEAQRVDLVVAVAHEADGAGWSYELELEYGGRPAAEPPKQAEPEPAPTPKPDEGPPPPAQPAPDRSSDAKPAPAPASSAPPPPPPPPAPATPAQRVATAPPAVSPSSPVVGAGGKTPAPVGALLEGLTEVGAGIPAAVGSDAAPRDGTRARSRARRRTRRPEPQALPGAPARPRPHGPATEGGVRLPDVDLPGLGSGLAWSVIGGGGLAFALAGLGVAGLGRHRRRRGLLGP